jgi:two-component system, NarL family, response regulator DesR
MGCDHSHGARLCRDWIDGRHEYENRIVAAGGSGMRGAVIRVLVAEDVRVVRETLVALLSLEEDIDVVAALAAGDRIVPAALQHHPDVALLDIDLPGVDGLTAAAELAAQVPGCRALILTGLGTPDNLRQALAAGAPGFLLKDEPTEVLIDAVRTVARGGRVIDPRLGYPPGSADADPPGAGSPSLT